MLSVAPSFHTAQNQEDGKRSKPDGETALWGVQKSRMSSPECSVEEADPLREIMEHSNTIVRETRESPHPGSKTENTRPGRKGGCSENEEFVE